MLKLRSVGSSTGRLLTRRSYAAAAPKQEHDTLEGESPAGSEPESSTAPLRRRLEAVVRERDAAIAAGLQASNSSMSRISSGQSSQSALPNPLALPIGSTSTSNLDAGPNRRTTRIPTGPRARALLRAQAIARALEKTQAPSPPPKLAATAATDSGPTLEDLLGKRPAKPPNTAYRSYPKMYSRLHNSISTAFLTAQLIKLAHEMGLRIGVKNSKAKIVERVMEDWGWPVPSSVESPLAKEGQRPEKGEKMIEKDIEMPASELFLFLRDQEKMKHFLDRRGVAFAFPQSSDATKEPIKISEASIGERRIMRVKSTLGTIEYLVRMVTEASSHVKTLTLKLEDIHGFKASQELLASVSNLSGAFVELEDDSYRLYARRGSHLSTATRLLNAAASQLGIAPSQTPVAALISKTKPASSAYGEPAYHLPPFFSTHSAPLPWYHAATRSGQPMFRMKNVTTWTTKTGLKEMQHWEERIEHAGVQGLRTASSTPTVDGSSRKKFAEVMYGLGSDLVVEKGKDWSDPARIISVQFGNILIPSKDTGIAATFQAPIKYNFTPNEMPLRIKEINTDTIFAPCLTPAMIQSAPSTPPKRLRRIRYRSSPEPASGRSAILTCTYTYPDIVLPKPANSTGVSSGVRTADTVERSWKDDLGELLERAVTQVKEEQRAKEAREMEQTESAEAAEYAKWEKGSISNSTPVASSASEVEDQDTAPAAEAEEDSSEVEAPADDSESPANDNLAPRIHIPNLPFTSELSWEAATDLLMPDRPIDCRITASSKVTIALRDSPRKVNGFFKAMHSHALGGEKVDVLLNPPSVVPVKIGDEERKFVLVADEQVEVQEKEILVGRLPIEERAMMPESASDSPFDFAPRATEKDTLREPEMLSEPSQATENSEQNLGRSAEVPQSAQKLFLRSIKVTDGSIPDQSTTYTELAVHGDTVPEEFWREFAYVAREVPPGAAALKRNTFYH